MTSECVTHMVITSQIRKHSTELQCVVLVVGSSADDLPEVRLHSLTGTRTDPGMKQTEKLFFYTMRLSVPVKFPVFSLDFSVECVD